MKSEKENLNSRNVWKLLENLDRRKSNCVVNVQPNALLKHFETMLTTKIPHDIPPQSNNNGPLDYEISFTELEKSASILRPGKANGPDNVSNEMLECLLVTDPGVILKLFNSVLNTSEIIPDWVKGTIVPIHKKGAKSDPANYRGITLMSCLNKLFLNIIQIRLSKFTLENNILHKAQLGS